MKNALDINPLVSICIPTYNGEKYLTTCLESALAQSYINFEIIIVDDQSKDSTLSIANFFEKKSEKIKVFSNKNNLGLVGNWNQCLEYAKGEWIKFLFQDDYLHKDCIEKMINSVNLKTMFVVANRNFIFENNVIEMTRNEYLTNIQTLQRLLKINRIKYLNDSEFSAIASRFANTNFIGEPTAVLFRRSIVQKIGIFNDSLVQLCDFEFWLRIASNFGLLYIPETLAYFRVHENSMSASNRISKKDLVDKIILTNELLFSKKFEKFRSLISKFQILKLTEMLKLRIYEVELNIIKNPKDNSLSEYFSKIKKNNSSIKLFEKASFRTQLIYKFLKLRRKINS